MNMQLGVHASIAEQDGVFYQPDIRCDEPMNLMLADRYLRYGFKKLFRLMCKQGNTGTLNAFTGFTLC